MQANQNRNEILVWLRSVRTGTWFAGNWFDLIWKNLTKTKLNRPLLTRIDMTKTIPILPIWQSEMAAKWPTLLTPIPKTVPTSDTNSEISMFELSVFLVIQLSQRLFCCSRVIHLEKLASTALATLNFSNGFIKNACLLLTLMECWISYTCMLLLNLVALHDLNVACNLQKLRRMVIDEVDMFSFHPMHSHNCSQVFFSVSSVCLNEFL